MASPKEVSVVVRAIDQITGPLQDMSKRTEGFVNGIKGVFTGLAAGFAALGIAEGIKAVVAPALEAEKSVSRLDAALSTIGLSYGQVRPEVEKYLDTLQKTTRYSDEDGREALTRLVAKTGEYRQSLNDMQLVVDLAAFKQIDLSESADLVAKAHAGGAKLAKEFNIQVKDGADFVPQLTAKLKDFEQNSRTTGDALGTTSNLWDEFKEKMGAALIGGDALSGGLSTLQKVLIDMTQWVENNSDRIGGWVGMAVDGAKAVVGALGNINDIWGTHAGVVGSAIDAEKARLREEQSALEEARQKVNAIYVKRQEDANAAARKAQEAADKVAEEKKKADKKAKEDAIAAAKKHHADLATLEEAAAKSGFELLSADNKAYEEVERTFREKMLGMTKADYGKAEALLKENHQNQLLAWAGLNAKLDTEVPKAQQIARNEIKLTGGVTTDFTAVLEKHGQKLDEGTAKTIAAKLRWAEFKDEAAKVAFTLADGADAMRGFLDALGLGDEKMDRLVAGVGDLAEGIGRLASGDIVGGLLKGIGGIKSALSGLFGKSEAEKKLEQALNKNRDRLEQLTSEIGDLNINLTGKQLAGTQGALKEFFATGGAASKGWGDRLGQLLLKRGVNMSDLEEVAKTLQIDISPNGHLDPRALQQLMQAIGAVEPTQFRNDFVGQREALKHQASIGNLSAAQQAQALAALAGGSLFGSGAIGSALAGVDFTTSSGRGSALTAIQSLFGRMSSLSASDLGGLTGSQFVDVLEELKQLLEDANNAGGPSGPSSIRDLVAASPTVSVGALPVFDLGGEALAHLASIDATLLAGGAGDLTIDARIGDLTFQFGGELAADRSQLQEAVQSALAAAQGDQIRKLEEALGSNYLDRKRSLGDASRTVG